MYKVLLYSLCLTGCLSSAMGSQNCGLILSGKVIDDHGGLPGATVNIVELNQSAITSEAGTFAFENLCEGEYKIQVSFVGFETRYLSVSLTVSQSLTITLSATPTLLQNVVIEGEQTSRSTSQTVSVLSKAELETLHGKPLAESLRSIPGVSTLQTGPAIFKPVIHGLHSQRILILNNGIRQEGQQWGVEHAPEIDPYIASQIEVVKGSETVRYGADAIGGVIIITPPALHKTEKFGGEVNLGLISNNRMAVFAAMLEGGIKNLKNWSWRMQSSVKKGGDFQSPDYNLSNTGLEELNFSGALGFKKTDYGLEIYGSSFNTTIGILRAAHTGNLSDLQQSIINERPWYIKNFTYDIDNPRQEINHHLLKLRAYKRVANLGKINLLYGGQYNLRKEFDIRRGGRGSRPATSMDLFSNVIDLSLDHEKEDHSGSLGVNGTIKVNTNHTEETGILPLIPDYYQFSTGLFFAEKLKRNHWIWEAGGRYDYQFLLVKTFANGSLIKPDFNFHFLSGTLGATFFVSSNLRLINNFGISSRPPHISELYSEGLHHGTASIEEGLMRTNGEVKTDQQIIKKEVSGKWITTLQGSSGKLTADLSVHINDFSNYVYIRPYETRLTIRGHFPVFRYEQTHARLSGTDLTTKWQITKDFSHQLKASYIYARDVGNDDILPFIPPGQIENGFTYNLKKLGRLEEVFFGVNFPYTFKQVRAPRTVYPEDLDNDDVQTIFDFAPAPEGYMLLNVQAGFKIPLHEHYLSFSIAAENLLDKRYRNYMNRLRYYADDTGRNFTVRMTYNFLPH